jgi:hypothetical protein
MLYGSGAAYARQVVCAVYLGGEACVPRAVGAIDYVRTPVARDEHCGRWVRPALFLRRDDPKSQENQVVGANAATHKHFA